MERLLRLRQHRAVRGTGDVDRLDSEEDASLGVDLEVRDGGRGELTRGRVAFLRLGLPLLAGRKHREARRDEGGRSEDDHDRSEPPDGSPFEVPFVCLSSHLLRLSPVPLRARRRDVFALLRRHRDAGLHLPALDLL